MTGLAKIRLVFLIFFCMSVPVVSATIQAKELIVGLGELDYPPFYFEENGTLQGAAVEIAQHISDKLGHTLVYKRFPWSRVQYSLQRGDIDMMILYFKTPEREKDAVFTDFPHIFESSYLVVAKDSRISYEGNLQKLRSHTFGNVRGYSHGKEYDGANFLDKRAIDNEILLLRMLVRARLDIAVGNKPVILGYAKQENLQDKIKFLSPSIDKGANYFAFSRARKDASELAKEFSNEVDKFRLTDAYNNILTKFDFDVPD